MERRVEENLQVLWDYMHMGMEPRKVDCIVGFGSLNLPVAFRAAELYRLGYAPKILFTGGLGRNTEDKWDGSEAERFARAAMEQGVPAKDIILEEESTNTAENILFTREKFQKLNLNVKSILAVHQQFMERRIYAALKLHWPELDAVITSPQTGIQEYLDTVAVQGMGEKTAIEVIVGDFQRMDLYAKKGWQIPQSIPERAWAAFHTLEELGYYGQLLQK